MDDAYITNLIIQSTPQAADGIWAHIKKEIAEQIAQELLATLDGLKEPRKQESLDRVEAMMLSLPEASHYLSKGA